MIIFNEWVASFLLVSYMCSILLIVSIGLYIGTYFIGKGIYKNSKGGGGN